MTRSDRLDARAKPPAAIRNAYKKLQRLTVKATEDESGAPPLVEIDAHSIANLPHDLRQIFLDFLTPPTSLSGGVERLKSSNEPVQVFQVAAVPGKQTGHICTQVPIII